jgi:hypothetical protein
MARRLLGWVLVTPVAAAGILAAHALAYRLTGTDQAPFHEYLAHWPQAVGVVATLGLVGLAHRQRSASAGPDRLFALVAPLGFVCQEHVERLVHTGELPWLLTTPAFLVGLALQVPVGLLCVVIARRVAGTLTGARRAHPPPVGLVWLPLSEHPEVRPREARRPRARGRAPPRLLAT